MSKSIHKEVSLKNLKQNIVASLIDVYEPREAESLSTLALTHLFACTHTDAILGKRVQVDTEKEKELEEIVNRLRKQEPVQYILGVTEFYGREFNVNSSTLIPRPETEELVGLITKENTKHGLKVLDIGTGSGCIATSLFFELNESIVHAIDIDDEALKIAKENAYRLGAALNFMQGDILSNNFETEGLDIIVSNPPYVRDSEKKQMHRNVLDYEPDLALFVSDNDPLIFYRRIAEVSAKKLRQGGKLYFEINEAYGLEVKTLMQDHGFHDVEVFKDLQGKDRMVRGLLS